MRKGQSRKFRENFKTFACPGDSITAELPGGFTATAWLALDDHSDSPPERDDGFWPSMDPKSAGYIGGGRLSVKAMKRNFNRQMSRAKEVLRAWESGEWYYVGVCVTIEKDGVQLTGNYDHALWGVDCNYPAPSRYRRKEASEGVGKEANALRKAILKATRAYMMQGGRKDEPDWRKPNREWFGAAGYALQHRWL